MVTRPETETLVVLHTNDIHSSFEQMPKLASAFKARAAVHGTSAHLLRLDIGDHLDRVRLETEGTQGQANVEIMNATGYEYVVLGNNEGLTFTPEMLRAMYEHRAAFTIVGSNIRERTSGVIPSWMIPHAIVEKGPLRVGLIGVTAQYNDFYELLGWHIDEPLETVRLLVQSLRSQVDLIIVMSHLGLGSDQKMAQEIAGIDCILGGHTHHLLEQPLRIGDTIIGAAGKLGYQFGELAFHFVRTEAGKFRLESVQGRTISSESFADDEDVLRLWHAYRRESLQTLQQPIATLAEPLQIDWFEESDMGNLLAAAIRRWTDAEIGIVNAGQLLESLEAGTVTRQKLLAICPSPINPCRKWMLGRDIKIALEESLLRDFQCKEFMGFGFRGKMLGMLCVDGLRIEVNRNRPAFQQITAIACNGEPFDEQRMYAVGTIDMFTFGIGYLSLKKGEQTIFYLPEFIRDLLADALSRPGALQAARERHWISI